MGSESSVGSTEELLSRLGTYISVTHPNWVGVLDPQRKTLSDVSPEQEIQDES